MSRIEKLLNRIRQNRNQVRFEEIDKVMQQMGFEERHNASHYVYSHPRLAGVVTIVRPHGKGGAQFVSSIYVKKALEAIDRLKGMQL